jgi:predicted metalloprotease with PDZ domain
MTIVNYASSIVSEQSFQLIDDGRVVIYDRHVFIVQAAGNIFGGLQNYNFCRISLKELTMTTKWENFTMTIFYQSPFHRHLRNIERHDRDSLMKGDNRYDWPPCTEWFRSA